jgi:hypothetical protein
VVSARATPPKPALVCALYSEDLADARQKFGTLEQIVRDMLVFVEERVKTNHLKFSPVAPDISGTYWKVTTKSKDVGAQQKRRNLLRAIATELIRGRVMFFHVDGDDIWSKREGAEVCAHLERFRRDLLTTGRQVPGSNLDERLLEHAFIELIPFYSIESWTYASFEHLRTLTRNATELELIAKWATDRRELDEHYKIKEALPSILDQHNHELAQRIPAAALHAIDKSYTATVERVRASDLIRAGLAETLQRPW